MENFNPKIKFGESYQQMRTRAIMETTLQTLLYESLLKMLLYIHNKLYVLYATNVLRSALSILLKVSSNISKANYPSSKKLSFLIKKYSTQICCIELTGPYWFRSSYKHTGAIITIIFSGASIVVQWFEPLPAMPVFQPPDSLISAHSTSDTAPCIMYNVESS